MEQPEEGTTYRFLEPRARNAQRSKAVLARGLADYLTRFLGSMCTGIPLDSFGMLLIATNLLATSSL
jgi:hypothetical protein